MYMLKTTCFYFFKSAHILLFFLAFVFGSFCTFCFHMLMYLFDDKCVLFPKLQSLNSGKQDVIYEFIPEDNENIASLPVDFVSSQWVERSACYLPTYVPLVSGIFGLVWTTMFLMCSTGSRTLTGLQRPWRVLPPVFIFSLAMGTLSLYSTIVTHLGLDELCLKLAEITGSTTDLSDRKRSRVKAFSVRLPRSSVKAYKYLTECLLICTYTVNVATLAYERRIRGVYQAIQLTVISAWFHTLCWIMSALLTLTRVILAVDFQLVRVNVELIGDIDKMLERHETQLHSVSPDVWFNNDSNSQISLPILTTSNKSYTDSETFTFKDNTEERDGSYILYTTQAYEEKSEQALEPTERHKLESLAVYENVPKDLQFIVKMLYDLLLTIEVLDINTNRNTSDECISTHSNIFPLVRQLGQAKIENQIKFEKKSSTQITHTEETEEIAKEMKNYLQEKLYNQLYELPTGTEPSTSKKTNFDYESTLNITEEMKRIIDANRKKYINQETNTDISGPNPQGVKKSNLKHASVQTTNRRKIRSDLPKVKITEPEEDQDQSSETMVDVEEETKPSKEKEKHE